MTLAILLIASSPAYSTNKRVKIPELDLKAPREIRLVTVAPLQSFEESGGWSGRTACVLHRALNRDLGQLNQVTVVGREELFSILFDYGWATLDFTEPEAIAKLARVTGVDLLFTGEYGKNDDKLSLKMTAWQREGDKLRRAASRKFHGKQSHFPRFRQQSLFNLLPKLDLEITGRYIEYFTGVKQDSYKRLSRRCAQETWRPQAGEPADGSATVQRTSADSEVKTETSPTKKLEAVGSRRDMNIFAAYRTGIELFRNGKFKPAHQKFLKVYRARPVNPNNLLWLACVEIKLGRWESARDRVQKVLNAQPNHRLAEAYLNHINTQLPVNR